MTDAYKCDRCGDFSEGSPCRRKYRSYMDVSAWSGWTDATTKAKAELCPDCAAVVDEAVEELFEGQYDA